LPKNTTLPRGSRSANGRGAFIYADFRDNHVIWPGRETALERFVRQTYNGMRHKWRPAHSSGSEDALAWSCFDTLLQLGSQSRQRALGELWQLAFNGEIIPPSVATGKIKIGEVYDPGERTEVDVSIEGDGTLVFIEAKLYSSMSHADEDKGKPHDQIAKKLRVGALEARKRNAEFFFILLDLAPRDKMNQMCPKKSKVKPKEARGSGFRAKWQTSWWFAYYKYGRNRSLSPLRTILADAAPGISVEQVSANMGWLTWADVFKSVLRAVITDRTS
jgi:hypothetical protein